MSQSDDTFTDSDEEQGALNLDTVGYEELAVPDPDDDVEDQTLENATDLDQVELEAVRAVMNMAVSSHSDSGILTPADLQQLSSDSDQAVAAAHAAHQPPSEESFSFSAAAAVLDSEFEAKLVASAREGAAAEATGDSDSDGQADAGEVEAELDAFFEPGNAAAAEAEADSWRTKPLSEATLTGVQARAASWSMPSMPQGGAEQEQFEAMVQHLLQNNGKLK